MFSLASKERCAATFARKASTASGLPGVTTFALFGTPAETVFDSIAEDIFVTAANTFTFGVGAVCSGIVVVDNVPAAATAGAVLRNAVVNDASVLDRDMR